jgi:hypothetical protein
VSTSLSFYNLNYYNHDCLNRFYYSLYGSTVPLQRHYSCSNSTLLSSHITLDICNLFSAALCPLPIYHFTGAESLSLDSVFDIKTLIQGVAYKIPDIEAYAQLTSVFFSVLFLVAIAAAASLFCMVFYALQPAKFEVLQLGFRLSSFGIQFTRVPGPSQY